MAGQDNAYHSNVMHSGGFLENTAWKVATYACLLKRGRGGVHCANETSKWRGLNWNLFFLPLFLCYYSRSVERQQPSKSTSASQSARSEILAEKKSCNSKNGAKGDTCLIESVCVCVCNREKRRRCQRRAECVCVSTRWWPLVNQRWASKQLSRGNHDDRCDWYWCSAIELTKREECKSTRTSVHRYKYAWSRRRRRRKRYGCRLHQTDDATEEIDQDNSNSSNSSGSISFGGSGRGFWRMTLTSTSVATVQTGWRK